LNHKDQVAVTPCWEISSDTAGRTSGGRTDECVKAELVPEGGRFVEIVDGADESGYFDKVL